MQLLGVHIGGEDWSTCIKNTFIEISGRLSSSLEKKSVEMSWNKVPCDDNGPSRGVLRRGLQELTKWI